MNRYSYVHNNPLTYNDPTGHKTSLGEDDNGNDIWVSNDGTRLSTDLLPGFDPMYSGGPGDFVPSQGTAGGGVQISIGLGIGIKLQVMGVVDSESQTATAITLSFIGTTPTFGIGPVAQRTDAKDVSDLSQWSGGAGASSWFTPGYDVMGNVNNGEHGYTGDELSADYNEFPVEVHASVGYTWLWWDTSK